MPDIGTTPGPSGAPSGPRHQFDVEQELARRLRSASPERRAALYREVYDELYKRVPTHPQLRRLTDHDHQRRLVNRQLRLLGRFLRDETEFLEVGAGDCRLALAVARRVRHVYAIDVSRQIARADDPPGNFSLVICDGASVPVPECSVDVAYSNQVMEHLHPDDAVLQLRGIYAALAPGGVYICRTPNLMTGPHDVSRSFGHEPRGLHLKEYTSHELVGLFRAAGFRRITTFVWLRGYYLPWSLRVLRCVERIVNAVPPAWRRPLTAGPPLRTLLGLNVVGSKS
jgi:SAM-dependent methyltransferase